MQMLLDKLTVGKLYKFDYHNKTRKVLVTNEYGNGATCWDFEAEDFRNFKYDNIAGYVKELVENTDYTVTKSVANSKSALVNGVLYTVKV